MAGQASMASKLSLVIKHGTANFIGLHSQPSQFRPQLVSCQVGQPRATVKVMLIAFTNTKGGVGKSTLASHLALWLFDKGYRVALLDSDEQETAARWVRAAEPTMTVVTATEMEVIHRVCTELLAIHDILVADTPGQESDAARTVTLLCDLAIVPLQPSKPDLRAIKDALKNIRLAQEISGTGRPEAHIVLNLTAKIDVQTKSLKKQLQEAGFPVANNKVRRLNALRDACDTAVTRMKASVGGEAARDLDALFTELLGKRLEIIARPKNAEINIGKAANE